MYFGYKRNQGHSPKHLLLMNAENASSACGEDESAIQIVFAGTNSSSRKAPLVPSDQYPVSLLRELDGRRALQGFSIPEVVVVLALLGILVSVSITSLVNYQNQSALKSVTNEIYRSLSDARNRTLGSLGDTVYGVFISTSSLTRFVGDTYTANNPNNKVYIFEQGVTATSTLISGMTAIVFKRLTGEPSSVGTITVRDKTLTSTRTLSIYSSGLVEY